MWMMCLLAFLMTLQVSAPAIAGCQATVSLMDFGRLDLEDEGEVTGELVVSCDEPGGFSVGLSPGLGRFAGRIMRGDDGNELHYNLFVDPARQRIWGDGVSAGTQTINGENDGRRPSIIPIYGVVPSGQNVFTGGYSDNLLVTIEKL
jgi:spore coat protein U-like protein